MHQARLIKTILDQYPLDISGIHGPDHWGRVLENGLHLATLTGADPEVVGLFAILHDCRRTNEGLDHQHGLAAAKFAKSLRGDLISLDDDQFSLLYEACADHTDGRTEADVTIQTCWDADRLDLGRVYIMPAPARLCTNAARDPKLIAWANERAENKFRVAALEDWFVDSP